MTLNHNDLNRHLDGDDEMGRYCGMAERAHWFADGELDSNAALGFEMHLVDCRECQEEILDALMLDFLDQRSGISAQLIKASPLIKTAPNTVRQSPAVGQIPPWWMRPAIVCSAAAAVAAAATIAIIASNVVSQKPHPQNDLPDPSVLALRFNRALSPNRSIEGRLSFAGADRYRPYNVDRAAPSPVEKIPNHLLGELEDAELGSGLVAAYVLMGADQRALDDLGTMAESAETLSDQAVLALHQNKPRMALKLATRALRKDPSHSPAEWNRAIALEQLDLPLAAATAFERVTTINKEEHRTKHEMGGQTGWADEATRRAKKHRADYAQLKNDWNKVLEAIDKMTDGIVPDRSLIRSHPGVIRLGFYDAIGTTAAPELLDKLKKTARALDEVYGGIAMSGHLQRVRSGNLTARTALAKRYAKVLAARQLDGDSDLYNDAVSASQLDIALLTLFYVEPLSTKQQAAYHALASKIADPWFELTAKERITRVRVERGDNLSAIASAVPALALCKSYRNMDYRCLRIHYWVAKAYANLYELKPAKYYMALATTQAQRTGDWMMQLPLLSLAAELSSKDDDVAGTGLPIVNAYITESLERWPACINATREIEKTAQSLIDQGRLVDAGNELRQLDRRCPNQEPSIERAFIDVQGIGTPGFPTADSIRTSVQLFRHNGLSPSRQQLASYIEGRASNDSQSTVLLRRAIELVPAPTAPTAAPDGPPIVQGDPRIRSYAYTTLAAKVARRGDLSATIDILAEEIGIIKPRCAVAFVFENGVAVAAKNASGITIGLVHQASNTPIKDLFPEHLEAHMKNCKSIDVFAKAPFVGRAVLPPHLPWRFRLTAMRASTRKPSRHVVVTDVLPPPGVDLPRLTPSPVRHADVVVRGRAATPTRVKSELEDATLVEIHTHGVASAEGATTSLVLSPDPDGSYALSADDLKGVTLRGHPVVILSACRAAIAAPHRHGANSLAGAFIEAGASAVIASPEPIPDAAAYAFFDRVVEQINKGTPVVEAVQHERSATTWTRQIVIFE